MYRTLAVAALALHLTAPQAVSKELGGAPDLFTLYDWFAVAQVVAETCDAPAEEEKSAYAAKWKELAGAARREALVQNPTLTESQFDDFVARRRESLAAQALNIVKTEGCETEDAVKFRARYREYLTLNVPE